MEIDCSSSWYVQKELDKRNSIWYKRIEDMEIKTDHIGFLNKQKKLVLFFSCGKDSIATWLYLRDNFPHLEIIPVYQYLVKGLIFVEESISYFQNYFKKDIIQIPHPSFFRWLSHSVFFSPAQLPFYDNFRPPKYNYDTIKEGFRKTYGDIFFAVGLLYADNIMRIRKFHKLGSDLDLKKGEVYPIAANKRKFVIDIIKKNNIKFPIDYELFGRSFDGIDYRYSANIKKHFPEDYKKICAIFPFVETGVKRYEYFGKT